MNYYVIRPSLNNKIVGKYSQAIDAVYSCSVWDEPKFIDHPNIHFKKNDFEPITAKAVLVKKAIPTDYISAEIMGFSSKLLISDNFKNIIQQVRTEGLQFYNSPVIFRGIELKGYWVLNPYIFNEEQIDFLKTEVFLQKDYSKKIEKLSVASYSDFLSEKKRVEQIGYPYSVFIEKPQFLYSASSNFLIIENVEGGTMYIASEYLKGVIEDAGITGIEFQPTTISLNEWLGSEGMRAKIYGKSG